MKVDHDAQGVPFNAGSNGTAKASVPPSAPPAATEAAHAAAEGPERVSECIGPPSRPGAEHSLRQALRSLEEMRQRDATPSGDQIGVARPSAAPSAMAAAPQAIEAAGDSQPPASEPPAGPQARGAVRPAARVETLAPTAPSEAARTKSAKADDEPRRLPAMRGKGGDVNHGGGGGGGGGTPLHRRSSEKEFRDVLGRGLAVCRRNLVVVGIFSVAISALVLAIPVYLFQISDRVLTSRSHDTLIMLTVIVVGAVALNAALDAIRRFILMRTAVEIESKLGAPVLSAAAKAAQNGSNREFQILIDLQLIRNFVTGPVLLTMFDAPVAPIFLAAVFFVHPHLGFIVMTGGLLLIVVALLNRRMTAVPFNHAHVFNTRANMQVDAMARNAQVINAMGMIPEAVMIWGRETAESLKAQVLAQDRNIYMAGLSRFLRMSTQIAILGWGAWLALDGRLTGGMVIAGSIIGSRALAPLEGTIEGWRNFIQARAAYARIKTLLQNSPLNFDRLKLPRPQGRLSVERVLYVPPPTKKVILNGINFQLEPGESLAIVGASGTGKSTLAKMLVGSITPTAGNVRLDMMDLRNWDPRQFGESVGYLPQDVQLFPASIKANIARMREDVTDRMIYEAAELADVHEMISQFPQGYETIIAVDGSPLSGGQKQRIGLARAFFGEPRLVVLDEPNSNLDASGELALGTALARAKQKGITIVAITQRPLLLNSVDKIMILHNGAVQALGTREEILPMLLGSHTTRGPARPNSGPPILDS